MNLKEIRIDINPLTRQINFVHIPTSTILCGIEFKGKIDWDKLREAASKNINLIAVKGDLIQVLFGNGKITIVNLENEEVIGEGEAKITMNWLKIAGLLLTGRL